MSAFTTLLCILLRAEEKSESVLSDNPRLSNDAGPRSSSDPLDLHSLKVELDSILATHDLTAATTKDLSFLLRSEIYYPLSQLEIPPMFRSSFYSPPIGESLNASMDELSNQLTQGHFLLAAHLSAKLLTSPLIKSSDVQLIFTLLYTRLACLELTGNSSFAAQEAKALEDLNSAFYYVDADFEVDSDAGQHGRARRSFHIVPWPLRVLAVRLQSIAFGDPRRSITGLYELAFEARKESMQPTLDDTEKQVWKDRLSDLGIRTVSALVEMGDLDAARRSLRNLGNPEDVRNQARAVLLALRIGDLAFARQTLEHSSVLQDGILNPLTAMSEGSYDEAAIKWKALLEGPVGPIKPMAVQNLAVCLLYTGQLNEVCYYCLSYCFWSRH
jgi:trafficking protein particle complex subunit 12